MPKAKFDKPKEVPPIDWMKAAIMERKQALKVTSEELGKAAGVSGDYIRKLITTKHTDYWPQDIRKAVCKLLGITVKTTLIITENQNEVRIN